MREAARAFGDFDYIVSPEARGFIFGAPLALELGKGFVPVRKPGKLPYKTVSVSYDLEYGSETIEMHEDALPPGAKALIVDDLLATGGTGAAIVRLVEKLGAQVVGFLCLIELTFLDGEKDLAGRRHESIIKL